MSNNEKYPDLSQWVAKTEAQHLEILEQLRQLQQPPEPDNGNKWVAIMLIIATIAFAAISIFS